MPNFSIPLTGLQADTTALDTIGNNLANLNTTAFKGQTTTFEDLFYQNLGTTGSGDSLQVGVGTRVSGTSSNFSQGSITTDSTSTDMALNGAGFFIVENGNTENLTRAGDFSLSSSGALITTSGESVMGYGAINGVPNTNGGLTPIVLPVGTTETAQATGNVALSTSLDSDAKVGTAYTTSSTIYDSLGASHLATVTYTKDSPTTWGYSIALPAGDYTGTPVNNTGTLTFNSSGQLTSPAADVAGVSFPGMVDGSSDLTFNFNLYNTNNNPIVSQTSGTSTTTASTQDGYAAGTYTGFTVDGEGVISAAFSNNHSAVVGQLVVGTVADSSALTRIGQNDFAATLSSGEITAGTGNSGGRGTVENEALEQSNVDISGEFSNLIVAQRAFEANSKTVTTFDTVTQEAIAMIR